MTKLFFAKDPIAQWDKILCPVCGEPTGPKSECYNLRDDKPKLVGKKTGAMPIYAKNCVYRNDNLWNITLNYPVSDPVVDIILGIAGIEKVIPLKAYTVQISIGHLFDEREIKRQFNERFVAFIKEMQALEIAEKGDTNDVITKRFIGIKFPNGTEWRSDNPDRDQHAIEDILETIPNAVAISSCEEQQSRE